MGCGNALFLRDQQCGSQRRRFTGQDSPFLQKILAMKRLFWSSPSSIATSHFSIVVTLSRSLFASPPPVRVRKTARSAYQKVSTANGEPQRMNALAFIYITQKNLSRYCAFPSNEKLEKNLLAAKVKQRYADLVRLRAVRTNYAANRVSRLAQRSSNLDATTCTHLVLPDFQANIVAELVNAHERVVESADAFLAQREVYNSHTAGAHKVSRPCARGTLMGGASPRIDWLPRSLRRLVEGRVDNVNK